MLGLPGAYAGIAILIAMLFDATSDPVVGVWSDDTRSRWGRRHPFTYASAFPVAFVYFFLWNPPALSEFWLFVYLTVASAGDAARDRGSSAGLHRYIPYLQSPSGPTPSSTSR